MKVLIVMAGYLPGKKCGGPPISVDNFCSLMKEFDCYVVTMDCDNGETERYKNIHEGWNQRNNCKVLYLARKDFNYSHFDNVINEIKPDVIYLQSFFQRCVPPCLLLARKHKIKVVLAPRGELCEGAISMKRFKKLVYITLFNVIGLGKRVYYQATSQEEVEGIHKYLKVEYDRIKLLPNIPSIPSKEYERTPKKSGEGRFIFLSRIHPKKNLLFAIELFNHVKGNVTFDIYGPIEDKEYWSKCQAAIAKLPTNIHVNYCGLVDHDKVHEVFSHYDAFLFPTLSENYGHVIAESMIVGTPVIISDQTPWNDINEVRAGWAIALDQQNLFVRAICEVIKATQDEFSFIFQNSLKYAGSKQNLKKLQIMYYDMLVKSN